MNVMYRSFFLLTACVALALPVHAVNLVTDGISQAPVILPENATPFTIEAAEDFIRILETMSGAGPELIMGTPDPVPEQAIWIGYQPVLDELFPNLDFDFQEPEEILFAATANHLVIAGRDVWDPDSLVVEYRRRTVEGRQAEYGTVNAVYTFLEDQLGVRWLWPGELGEVIPRQETVTVEPFTYRYHPQVRSRTGLLHYSGMPGGGYGTSHDWTRRQRLQLDSLYLPGGHAFSHWWELYHESHPEYFALQPDGTRSGFPSPRTVKICQSNPAVWERWMEDVEKQLEQDPMRTVFNASPNDGWASGHCICDDCRAWDHPDGELRTFRWAGLGQQYVALSDRDVTFANKLGELLKEKYPDKDYYVLMMSYGHSRPAPIEAKPAENVIISSVANFFQRTGLADRGSPNGTLHKDQFTAWAKLSHHIMWRPNTGSPAGWQQGQLDVSLRQTIDDFKYVTNLGLRGIFIDGVWEHWGTHGPLYYVMGQLIWDPSQDGEAILKDYYEKGFGPAAEAIAAYWDYAEETRETYVSQDQPYWEIYDDAFFEKAYGLLEQADAAVANAEPVYSERIDFFRAGLRWTEHVVDLRRIMTKLRESHSDELEQEALAIWEQMEQIPKDHKYAINWGPTRPITPRMRGLHPDSLKGTTSSQSADGPALQDTEAQVPFETADEGGWTLAFHDDFERQELGDNWQVFTGEWEMKDGALEGSGAIATASGYPEGELPGYQRLEFKAQTTVQAIALGEGMPQGEVRVSDLSSFIHARPMEDLGVIKTGYFFQFGGFWNKRNQLRKQGADVKRVAEPKTLIEPNKLHHVVVENNQGHVRFFVDETLVLDYHDQSPLIGTGQDRAGFYFHTSARIEDVKVYVKLKVSDLDLD